MKHVDLSALDPLFEPWEIPHLHREKADAEGMPAKIVRGRRPSPVPMVQALRREVSEWRDAGYPGASDTTQTLFAHWFGRSHSMETDKGLPFEFRYYFCQREAIETFVYLMEIRGITRLSRMYDEFGGADRETLVLGVTEEEDRLARYALKVATGAGKTKIMSLVIAWSYFHAVRESYSPMPRAFLVIAPNLTVYERLKDDFGDGRIFETDPILPAEWRGDWNLSVVLQDAAGGGNASAGGAVLYLTNIHRLYDPDKRVRAADTYGFMGPAVSRSKALNTGETLRARIASHGSLLVLNDEAHHVWDPDSAWNEAIASIHDECRSLGGQGVLAQLDLSATPKDNQGNFFKHIICDTPLGEAVDAGIVKTPVIGSSTTPLKENPSEDAAVKYEQHLLLGYECWKRSADEWKKSGRKPLLFVMCEDTEAADAITRRLDSDERFKLLNGRTINLHTNLKGKLKKVGSGASATYQFIENESDISNEDLRRLREISRQLDSDSSPWLCIVSVLMLREGWDVRNVTTIVPLRAFSSKARILPEQTLGRGLRRMTVPGKAGAHEIITVVEHPAFAHLYDQELAQEGLFVDVIDAEQIPKNTVSIYPDPRKDQERLDIPIPTLDPGFSRTALLPPIPWKDIEVAFSELALSALPLAGATERVIEYEGKALITGELIERFKIDLGLAATPLGAISFYRKQIEDICKIQNTHRILGPLLERFITEILFGARLDLFDPRLAARLGDGDVQEYIRAVFVPLVRTKITVQQKRKIILPPRWISTWSPYQATSNERHPCLKASATLFNLVPCTLALETAFVKFADGARDVAAFSKNAGPECLRIDYISSTGALAYYTPDFLVRSKDGACFIVETKGRVDTDVPRKADAAMAWCAAASEGQPDQSKWRYVYIQQDVFQRASGSSFLELVRMCEPALKALADEPRFEELPLFAGKEVGRHEEEALEGAILAAEQDVSYLPERYKRAVAQAETLFRFLEGKEGMSYAPAFNALLGVVDDACTKALKKRLLPYVPLSVQDQKAWFNPKIPNGEQGAKSWMDMASNLKRTLIFDNGLSPTGLLRNCLDFSQHKERRFGGVFDAIISAFDFAGVETLLESITRVNELRNHYVAHQDFELTDHARAEAELQHWVRALLIISKANEV